jgi:hypothetical protein
MEVNCSFAHRFLALNLAVLGFAVSAHAVQFPFLDSTYTQSIFTGPLPVGAGGSMAWTSGGNMLVKYGSNILEYSTSSSAIHNGTSVHPYTLHSITGLGFGGYSLTNGLDGYTYVISSNGLQRFNAANWALAAQTLTNTPGSGYGITTMHDGKIAYVAGYGSNEVHIYDPSSNTDSMIFTGSGIIDGIATNANGQIALAGQSASNLQIISSSGSLINTVNTFHYPDGMAFGDGVSSNALFTNNNDGTITRYQFASGFVGTPTVVDIATGSGAYGDLAGVGPDCAFYVTQFENGSYHGATPGVGTNWDNGITNAEASITRISTKNGDCQFYNASEAVPEPASIVSFGIAGIGLLLKSRRTCK